jgi:hypothetical protein
MVHARSVAEVAIAALGAPAARGRTYHVTEDDELSGEEFVAAFAEGLGLPIRVIRVPEPVALVAAKAADLFRTMTGGGSPGYRSAVRFLKGGNPLARPPPGRAGLAGQREHARHSPHAIQEGARSQIGRTRRGPPVTGGLVDHPAGQLPPGGGVADHHGVGNHRAVVSTTGRARPWYPRRRRLSFHGAPRNGKRKMATNVLEDSCRFGTEVADSGETQSRRAIAMHASRSAPPSSLPSRESTSG